MQTIDLLDLPTPAAKFVQIHCERCGRELSKLRSSRVPETASPYANLCGSCITPVEYAGMLEVLDTYITPTPGQYLPMAPARPLTYDEGYAMITDGIVASTDESAEAPKASATRPNKPVKASKKATKAAAKGKPVPLDLEPAPAATAKPAQKASKTAAGKATKGAVATLLEEEETGKPAVLKNAKTKGTKKVSTEEAELLGEEPKPAAKKAAAKKAAPPANDTKLSADDVFKALKKAGGTATVSDLATKNKWMPVRVHGAALALKSQKRITYGDKTLTIAGDDPLA